MDDVNKKLLDDSYKEALAKAEADIRAKETYKLSITGRRMGKDAFDEKINKKAVSYTHLEPTRPY